MNLIVAQLIPLLIFLVSLAIPLLFVFWAKRKRKGKRNPLTAQMLRNPGESIAQRIEELDEKIDSYLVYASTMPLMVFSAYMSARYIGQAKTSPLFFIVIAVGFLLFFSIRLNQTIVRRHKEQLGLDCERAVGQELNQLMLDGYRVYHDFQADGFNIDHIAIGSNGVFAIETKGRPKPDRGKGQEDVRVTYDGNFLQFPMWREKEPLDQARRQATWLAGWLSKSVGEQVAVRPVLALTGWFIERKAKDMLIYNGKNPQYLTKVQIDAPLTTEFIQRIAHQVEQQCRDVKPLAYKRSNQ